MNFWTRKKTENQAMKKLIAKFDINTNKINLKL